MNQLTKMFDGQNLTIIEKEGEPYFLLRDVCHILELGQVAGVKRRLEDEVITNHPIEDSLGRTQQAIFVNEDGLYDVILDSRKPEAKRFRKWITSEVIPSIRKTGGYQKPKNQLEILQVAVDELTSQDKRISNLEENMRINSGQEFHLNRLGKKKVIESLGGYDSPAYKEMSSKVFARFWRDFKQHFVIPRYGDLPKNKFDDGVIFIKAWHPDTSTRLEIDSYNQQQTMRVI